MGRFFYRWVLKKYLANVHEALTLPEWKFCAYEVYIPPPAHVTLAAAVARIGQNRVH